MLLVAFIFLAIGFALMHAGVHSGAAWRYPWKPFVEQLGKVG